MDNKTAKFKSTFIKRVDDEHVLKKNYSHELTGLLPSIHKPRSINSPLCKHITSASILIQIFKAKQSTHNRMHEEQSCFSPFATVPANHLECQAHFQKKFPTIDRIKTTIHFWFTLSSVLRSQSRIHGSSSWNGCDLACQVKKRAG